MADENGNGNGSDPPSQPPPGLAETDEVDEIIDWLEELADEISAKAKELRRKK